MCTVTYIPLGNHFFFTSNRDESADRPIAIIPQQYEIGRRHVLYPTDPQGGGTWIAVHESGNSAVLLNGANKAHIAEPPYLKSRGLVLLDIISERSPVKAFSDLDFARIEPFTIILFENNNLYSCKWDGITKFLETHNRFEARIWSSVTLYDPATIDKREKWFARWIADNPHPSAADIIRFHFEGGDGDPVNDFNMNREDKLYTNSISCIRHSEKSATFQYVDLRNGITSDSFLSFHKMIPVKA
jgi:Transport and Golgi organisation 2